MAELEPTVVVDVATLTGAMRVALGERLGGLFANDEALATALREAGEASGEQLWRFPLVEDYEQHISSNIADARVEFYSEGQLTDAQKRGWLSKLYEKLRPF